MAAARASRWIARPPPTGGPGLQPSALEGRPVTGQAVHSAASTSRTRANIYYIYRPYYYPYGFWGAGLGYGFG